MKKAFLKKTIAIGASLAMMLGSSIASMATEPEHSGTGVGTGTSTGHLDTSYVEATLPTDKTIAGLFSFYVDPEDIIGNNTGVKFTADGSAVTGNDDLVYFPQATAGTYASTSQNLELTIKNYEDVDVKVTAAVSDMEGISLVENDDDFTDEAQDDALLYLTLKVGSEEAVALTDAEDGVESVALFDGQSDNFEVKGTAGNYTAECKTGATWGKIAIGMTGKAQLVKDATGIAAPKVTLTYDVAIHEDEPADAAPSIAVTEYTLVGGTPATVSYSLGRGEDAATGITSVTWTEYSTTTNLYTNAQYITADAENKTFTLTAKSTTNMAAKTGTQHIVVTFDTGDVVTLEFTKE